MAIYAMWAFFLLIFFVCAVIALLRAPRSDIAEVIKALASWLPWWRK